jgi:hypothetical protein
MAACWQFENMRTAKLPLILGRKKLEVFDKNQRKYPIW